MQNRLCKGTKDDSGSLPPHSVSDYPLRVLLYSHDSVGLGHLRRNLAIAKAISLSFPNSNNLIVTGSPCATQFRLPANTDMIKIPSISKDAEGRYVPRDLSVSLEETVAFRSAMILDSFLLFKPTLIIIDHQLIGMMGEALEMLREAKSKGVITIYGSRDIKDASKKIIRTWDNEQSRWALRECYDRVCVYGMRELFDPQKVYAPAMDGVKHLDFTGFIIPPIKERKKISAARRRKRVLVTFGGGGDGVQRAETYLQALKLKQVHWDSHIITGPLMDRHIKQRIHKQAQKLEPIGSVKVQRFHRNIPALLHEVDAVVSMAGYNSCAEILQTGTPAVLLPRSFPRQEQLIRAKIMAKRGWASFLSSEDTNPHSLLDAVETALLSSHCDRSGADLNGLGRLVRVIEEQLISAGLVKNRQSFETQLRKSAG